MRHRLVHWNRDTVFSCSSTCIPSPVLPRSIHSGILRGKMLILFQRGAATAKCSTALSQSHGAIGLVLDEVSLHSCDPLFFFGLRQSLVRGMAVGELAMLLVEDWNPILDVLSQTAALFRCKAGDGMSLGEAGGFVRAELHPS